MIIEFLLATALDMSLPEFQPKVDLSGNYIVGTYDVSSDEIIVEEVPADEVPIEEPGGALRGLSPEPVPEEVITSEEIITRSDSTYLPTTQLKLTISDNKITRTGYYAETMYKYVTLESGNTYSIDSDASIIYVGNNITVGTELSILTGSSYTATSTMYIFVLNENTLNVSIDTSGNEPGGDTSGNEPGDDTSGNEPGDDTSGNEPGGNITADLTAVENKLDKLIVLLRSMLLVSAVSFLYPLIISVFNNIGGGKNV